VKQKNAVLCSGINLYSNRCKYSMHSVCGCSELWIDDIFALFSRKIRKLCSLSSSCLYVSGCDTPRTADWFSWNFVLDTLCHSSTFQFVLKIEQQWKCMTTCTYSAANLECNSLNITFYDQYAFAVSPTDFRMTKQRGSNAPELLKVCVPTFQKSFHRSLGRGL
jgi:hypothetical protein